MVEQEAETDRKRANIQALKLKDVSSINMEKEIKEKVRALTAMECGGLAWLWLWLTLTTRAHMCTGGTVTHCCH